MTRQAARRIAAWSGAAVLAVAVTACGSGAGGEASFRLDVAPDPVAIVQGGAQAVEVTIDRPAEFTAPVALSLTGAPDGIEGAFDPGPATGTDSTLMLTVAADTPTGEHRVSVRGAADGATASAGLTVDVVEAAPPSTIEVDSDLTPDAPDLPPFEDGEPRPVTTLTDDSGVLAHFVANELVVVADDEAELNALLDRHDGTLLATIDLGAEPSTADATPLASDVPTMHLVRVEAAPADADLLIEDLRTIRPDARSDLVVGSDAGLNLLAAAAQEAIAGLSVAVNWVGESHGFTDGVSNEAPVVEDSDGRYDSPNVFDWSYMGAEQLGIGVAQAWWALEASGKLDEVVRIAILDGGFLDNDDVPSGWTAVSVVCGAAPI